MKGLNIPRIILFVVALFLVHVLIGTLIPDFEAYEEPGARVFWLVTEYLVQSAIEIAIFVKLARVQARLLYVHVICVLVLCDLLGYTVMYALDGHILASPLMGVVLDYSVLAVSTVVGTEIGRRLRVAAEKNELFRTIRRN